MLEELAMRKTKATVYAVALLIIGFGVFLGGNLSFAGETNLPRNGQTTGYDGSDNPTDENVNSEVPICPGCPGNNVVITNRTFYSGTNCICVGYESITIGPEVTVENGATVTFSAPKVYLKSGFNAKQGSVVSIETEEPPPPP